MSLSNNQTERINQLKNYLSEIKEVEKEDFEYWFHGKKTVCTNILAYLILIEKDL